MKRCGRCGEWKAAEDFNFRHKAAGTRHTICRSCMRVYRAAYNERHTRAFLHARIAAHTVRYRFLNRKFVDDYLRQHPCTDCGESDIVVLEFDHVRGQKRANVSVLAARGVSRALIAAEMSKCDVRCANCHRRRTASTRHKMRERTLTLSAPPPRIGRDTVSVPNDEGAFWRTTSNEQGLLHGTSD
jgi:protein-arginine kinase activator protein McsA